VVGQIINPTLKLLFSGEEQKKRIESQTGLRTVPRLLWPQTKIKIRQNAELIERKQKTGIINSVR